MESPLSRPYGTITVRRNPPRRARATPSKVAVPISLPLSPPPDCKSIQSSSLPVEEEEEEIQVPPHKPSGDEILKVYLRIRPQSISEGPSLKKAGGGTCKNVWPQSKQTIKPKQQQVVRKKKLQVCLKENDNHSVTLCPPQTLQDQKRNKSEVYQGFSQVFSADSSQEHVFDKMMNPIVEDFLKGKSGMLAALGPSGSGKTHTLFGTTRQPGMIPLAIRRIFSSTQDNEAQLTRTFYLSMFEICSERGKTERLLDLCNDGVDLCLQQSTIRGLHESVICDIQQAEALIAQGMLKRATAMTNSNSQSSRSQCIINIRYESCDKVNASVNGALLTIVDLAGAEREKRTGNQGTRLLESNFINNTSMVFGLCLRSLLEHQKNKRKPLQKHFKNSLLTRYLRDYMEGKKRMALILTVKSGEEDYLDASFLLRQASPYMKIKFTNSEEPSDLIGNKRQLQSSHKADKSKKLKTSTIESPLVNEDICDGVNSTSQEEGHVNETTMMKVNEVDTANCLPEYPETSKSKIGESKFVKNNIDASKENRLSQIMHGFAKAAWQVLKQYKEKVKVAEKEICCLRQSLSEEKSRSEELEKELARIRCSVLCEEKVSTDEILIKGVGCREAGQVGTAEVDYQSADSPELARVSPVHLSKTEYRENNQSTNSTLRRSSMLSTSCVDEEIYEEQDCQVAGLSFVNPREHKFRVNNEITNSSLRSSGVVSTSCVDQDIFIEQCCQVVGVSSVVLSESKVIANNQTSDSNVTNSHVASTPCVGEEIFIGQCSQKLVESSGGAEDLEILEGKEDSNHEGNTLSEHSASSIHPDIKSDDNSYSLEEHQSRNGREKIMPDQTEMSNKAPQAAQEVVLSPKPPNTEKPKRRLQPASSMLLKNIRVSDIEEETEKPKGARGAAKKNMGLDLTRRTQGSLSLLRLLKDNL